MYTLLEIYCESLQYRNHAPNHQSRTKWPGSNLRKNHTKRMLK